MRILLIEDESDNLNDFISDVEKQYIVDFANNAEEGAYMSETNDYDVIVIHTSLENDYSDFLCRSTREAEVETPILLLADRGSTELSVRALDSGADACLYKPIHPLEFSAQLRALVRRRHGAAIQNTIYHKGLKIDILNKSVYFEDKKLPLRRKEFDILEYLLLNKSRIVSKETLLEHVWEDGILVRSNTLEVHIRNLRKKILDSCSFNIVETYKGFGYKLCE